MAPHVGDEGVATAWARANNDLIARCVALYPETFVGVCMLPQNPNADMAGSVGELERCVVEHGFIGCNLNPDPGGGHFNAPPLTEPGRLTADRGLVHTLVYRSGRRAPPRKGRVEVETRS